MPAYAALSRHSKLCRRPVSVGGAGSVPGAAGARSPRRVGRLGGGRPGATANPDRVGHRSAERCVTAAAGPPPWACALARNDSRGLVQDGLLGLKMAAERDHHAALRADVFQVEVVRLRELGRVCNYQVKQRYQGVQ